MQYDLAGSAAEQAIKSKVEKWQCIDTSGTVRIPECGTPLSGEMLQQIFPMAGDRFGRGFVDELYFSQIPSTTLRENSNRSTEFGYMNNAGKYIWLTRIPPKAPRPD